MSRSNPYKPKHRQAKRTAQIVVEGFTEEAFCRHLKAIFARDCGVSVEVHNARGGAPKDVVLSALRRMGFDKTILMYDSDVALEKSWASKARAAGFALVTSSPCVEALYLELLGEPVPPRSDECKRAFSKHLDDSQKYDHRAYGNIFPKEMLEKSEHPAPKELRSAFGK